MDINSIDYKLFSENVVEETKHIYENYKKAEKYSDKENDIIDYIEEGLKKDNKTLNIEKQEFEATKKSHVWVYFTACLFLLSIFAYFYLPILSPLLIIISLFPFLFSFLRSNNLNGFLFEKVKSQNLISTLRPIKNEPKKRVIFISHVDSAKTKKFNSLSIDLRLTIAVFLIIFCLYTFCLSIISMSYTGVLFRPLYYYNADNIERLFIHVGLSLLFFIPLIALIFFTNSLRLSPSVNTSLTSTLIIKEMFKELKKRNLRPENLEIKFIIAGSSENNLQGIKFLFKNDKNFSKDLPTVAVSLEALFEKSNITANKIELRLIPTNSKDIIEVFNKVTKTLNINTNSSPYLFRNTESKIFNKNQIPATSITAEPLKGKYYASNLDKPSLTDPECINRVAKILLSIIEEYDIM